VKQRYRFRTPSSGRELILEADPDLVYHDHVSGEPMEVIGKVLPLAPSESNLPWSVATLRICPHCGSMAQRDLNQCPTCGRRMTALAD
jgi:hypothetical protein